MTVKVLKSRRDIDEARSELNRMKASFLTSRLERWLRRSGLLTGVSVGDRLKSWDVLLTAQRIRDNLPKNSPVLDIGAYSSEILLSLSLLGYSSLAGVDLNPEIKAMPLSDVIRYEISDFTQTRFPDESFAAVTAISVIEHGFRSGKLLKEVVRLLRSGGYFIASFDYWPEKIDTSGIRLFGSEWDIFSKDEVLAFLEEARSLGLAPCGEIDLEAKDRPISFAGKSYTFAWLAARKM